jgi:hypothetical protein
MNPINVFEPENSTEVMEGWILHTTRRRLIHEREARRFDQLRLYLGLTSSCLAAVTGTSAFAAWQREGDNAPLGIATAAFGIAAAILASALTFLDPGARAEAHRRAAVSYKGILRGFEEACGLRANGAANAVKDDELRDLRNRLDEADLAAPVVPLREGRRIEDAPIRVVTKAEQL